MWHKITYNHHCFHCNTCTSNIELCMWACENQESFMILVQMGVCMAASPKPFIYIIDMKLEWCYKDVLKCCDILITDLELQAHETNHVLWFGTLQRQSYKYLVTTIAWQYPYYTDCYEYRLVVSHKCFTSTIVWSTAYSVCEFLSDAPFSNLVSERCALPTNCACVSGWS